MQNTFRMVLDVMELSKNAKPDQGIYIPAQQSSCLRIPERTIWWELDLQSIGSDPPLASSRCRQSACELLCSMI